MFKMHTILYDRPIIYGPSSQPSNNLIGEMIGQTTNKISYQE